jgi:hypothetical protein
MSRQNDARSDGERAHIGTYGSAPAERHQADGSSGGIGMEYYCYANCYSLGGI